MPSLPGVYWFLGEGSKILYVGKAKNLDHRLRSYTRFNQLNQKTKQLLKEVVAVNYQSLNSEFQALLVEAELIQLHQPHYNILLKDDKSPLYIVITKEDYPRVLSVRKSDLNLYSAKRVFGPFPSGRQVKQVLNLARRIFPFCNASQQDKNRRKPCFYYHLELCPGTCIGEIDKEAYQNTIKTLELFLQGKHKETTKELTKHMKEAADRLDFETAQSIKHKINAIAYTNAHAAVKIIDEPLPDIANNSSIHRSIELRRILAAAGMKLPKLDRIEAYDVANIQGQNAAVSMIVATQGDTDTSQYRHFHIKTLKTPNDVGMLKEVLIRRQRHPEWGIPDLIIVDGGLTQIKGVLSVMEWAVPVLGLAKQPDRLVVYKEGKAAAHRLHPDNPGSRLVIKLRNEAHRFARRLHHKAALKDLLD